MVTVTSSQNAAAEKTKRTRGPAKSFPIIKLEDVLLLPRGIIEHSVGDQIRRITLFDKLGKSPDSGQTRQIISSSSKYGLTTGSYAAEYLSITADGRALLDEHASPKQRKERQFKVALGQFDVFAKLYEKLKTRRLPDPAILKDDLGQLGVVEGDRSTAADVFVANARFLGLVRDVSGNERLIPMEQVLEELEASPTAESEPRTEASSATPARETPPVVQHSTIPPSRVSDPSVHIDIQIHIDSTATAEQIDQIFASMARHLYRRDN